MMRTRRLPMLLLLPPTPEVLQKPLEKAVEYEDSSYHHQRDREEEVKLYRLHLLTEVRRERLSQLANQ
jgi:hypothetical protein